MGLFQTLLLAASLGWSVAAADDSSNTTSYAPPTTSSFNPHGPPSLTHPLVSIITKSSLILYSPITTPYPHQPYHHLPHHSISPSSSPTSITSAAGSSGGLLIDTRSSPTVIQTYIVAGTPVVPGQPTEIGGTTYSVAASGTALYADGAPVSASDAVIGNGRGGGGGATATATSETAAGASSSGSASTGGAGRVRSEKGRMVGLGVGMALGWGML